MVLGLVNETGATDIRTVTRPTVASESRVVISQRASAGMVKLSAREQMAQACARSVEASREADAYAREHTHTEEPLGVESPDYPMDRIVDIPKVRKLNRRS